MPDDSNTVPQGEQTSQEPVVTPVEDTNTQQDPPAEAATEETPGESAPEGAEAEADEEIADDITPDVARKLVEKTRKESANYRTQLREAQAALAKLEGAKSLEEFKAAQADWTKQLEVTREENHKLLVENVIRQYDVPEDLADLVTGNTREELIAKAEKLAKHVGGGSRREPDGGLTPSGNNPKAMTPGELAAQYRRRHIL